MSSPASGVPARTIRSQILVRFVLVIADRDQRVGIVSGRGHHANWIAGAAAAALQVDEEDDRKLQPFRGVNRHQVHGVHGIDNRVRLVAAGGELIEVLEDARHRRVPTILDAAHEASDLLEVLARLSIRVPAHFSGISGFSQHVIEDLGGRNNIDELQPARDVLACQLEPFAIVGVEQRHDRRRLGPDYRCRESRREHPQRRVRETHEPRAQEGRDAQL
jgi:hypothetical protein